MDSTSESRQVSIPPVADEAIKDVNLPFRDIPIPNDYGFSLSPTICTDICQECMRFTLRVINLHRYITKSKKEYYLSKKAMESSSDAGLILLRVSDNYIGDECRKILNESLEKLNETSYWLQLLYKSDYLSRQEFESIYSHCTALKNRLKSLSE